MFKIKKSIIFFIIFSFAAAYLGGEKILYLIFYTITGVFALSFLSFHHTVKNVNGYQKYDKRDYHVDDEVEILSYIYNDTLFPIPYLEIRDRSTESIISEKPKSNLTFLKPNDKEIIKTRFKAKFRGVYKLGPIEIRISDVFNVFSISKTIDSQELIKIYPRVHILNRFNLNSMQSFGSISTKQRAYEDNTSILDIKKYNIGDSIKKVHWKISAKKGELYVKNYNMSGSPICYIFLDLKNNCYGKINERELEEKAVESVISIISYMLRRSISVNLCVNSRETYYEDGRDIKEIIKFMDMLCNIKTGGENLIKDIIQKRIRIISSGSSIIIVTGKIEKDDIKDYCNIKGMRFDVIIIYVSNKNMEKEIELSLEESGIKIYIIKSDSNIKEVLDNNE